MMSIIITVTLDSLCHAEIQISWSPFPEKDFADVIFMTEWAELFPVVWNNYMGLAECLTMWSWYTQSTYYMNLLLEWTSLSGGKAPSDNTLSAQHTKYVLQYALMFHFCIYSWPQALTVLRGQNLILLQLKFPLSLQDVEHSLRKGEKPSTLWCQIEPWIHQKKLAKNSSWFCH